MPQRLNFSWGSPPPGIKAETGQLRRLNRKSILLSAQRETGPVAALVGSRHKRRVAETVQTLTVLYIGQ